MGVYDIVLLEKGLSLPDYEPQAKSWKVSWQTRSFRDPMYRLHVVSEDGLLYRADQNYESTGFVESHGETGTFGFLQDIQDEDYSGNPRQCSDFDWNRIRYIGNMRVTAQSSDTVAMYDLDFDRHSISDISKVFDPLGDNFIQEGDVVFDMETDTYEVVELTDKKAKDYISKEEVKERGHTIYEKKTVADLNPDYPEDDRVVIIKSKSSGREMAWPESRLTKNLYDITSI